MAEPASDDIDFDSRLHEVDRGRVPEEMRRDPPGGAGVIEIGAMAPHDLVDAEAGERMTVRGEDRRRLGRRRLV